MKIVLLLTACINPVDMPFTIISKVSERYNQYIDALNFYIENVKIPIVFCENSNTDIGEFHNNKSCKQIELLTFDGNHDKTHGKGYGEAEIIEYAIMNSNIIDKNAYIIKITGRLVVKNINSLITQILLGILPKSSIICLFNSDYSVADSRIIIAPCPFYQIFLDKKFQIHDKNGLFFEHILSNTIKEQKKYCYFPFIIDPQIIGVSGSTGTEYVIKEKTLRSRFIYLQYRLQQQIILTKKHRLKKLCLIRYIIVHLLYLLLRLVNKLF